MPDINNAVSISTNNVQLTTKQEQIGHTVHQNLSKAYNPSQENLKFYKMPL